MASAAGALDAGTSSSHAPANNAGAGTTGSSAGGAATPAAANPPDAASTSSSSSPPAAPNLPAEMGDQWEYNKPVNMRSAALNEELSDCLGCFWRWVTCGGPGARVRQLYVNGRLSRCMDEYTKFKNCLAMKLDPEADMQVLPGPHPVWHIRTRRAAHEFWTAQYEHLGARRREGLGEAGGIDISNRKEGPASVQEQRGRGSGGIS